MYYLVQTGLQGLWTSALVAGEFVALSGDDSGPRSKSVSWWFRFSRCRSQEMSAEATEFSDSFVDWILYIEKE